MLITFDCYGTLIDWEAGILAALRPLLKSKKVDATDETILTIFAEEEANAETGDYIAYYKVLRQVVRGFAYRYNFSLTHDEADSLAASIKEWQPFPDTVAALTQLKEAGHSLGVITNCDNKLFEHSNALLGRPFDLIVTAEDAGAYKPSIRVFRHALDKIDQPKNEIIHVAQSVFHDIVPASALGLQTVWINRRYDRPRWGATPAANGRADHEFNDLKSFAYHNITTEGPE